MSARTLSGSFLEVLCFWASLFASKFVQVTLTSFPVHRREGTRAYFKAETQSPAFRDLQQLFEKTAGLAPILEQILKPSGNKIQSAFIYGSVARSREHAMSDMDVMVIGRAGLADLSPALRKAEERLGREVNVTAYSPEEFREKIKSLSESARELTSPIFALATLTRGRGPYASR